jgi:uncharacterized RDD family membrane protein YckC
VNSVTPLQSDSQDYAGFWRRVLASIIDWTIIGFPCFFVLLVTWRVFNAPNAHLPESSDAAVYSITIAVFTVVSLGQWIYFALMESSSKQATIGKLALKIRVTDMSGNRISFGRASMRYFAKYISYLVFFVGYLMAAFTQKKQALHDIAAKTLVLRNN